MDAFGEAIRTLEAAVRLGRSRSIVRDLLAAYRAEIFPAMASYTSVDAALDSWEPDSGKDAWLLDELANRDLEREDALRRTYLRGRVLQQSGRAGEAAREFEHLAELDPRSMYPHLRLVESLCALGSVDAAEKHLRDVLKRDAHAERALWNLWVVVCLRDLPLSPAEVLERFPGEDGDTATSPQDYSADIRWLLTQLPTHAIRINCGGDEYTGREGEVWGQDRFFRGGRHPMRPYREPIKRTENDALYQTERLFPRDRLFACYHIPLPTGSYRVTLHFAETRFTARDRRRFDVAIDGDVVLEDHEPLSAGFATAYEKTYDASVQDGILEIEFTPRVECPKISGIEIEWVTPRERRSES
jgi:tetratricopeptide (TPR) repeat protein